MSSKFRSSKSYPKPAHVCHAPIPGNPQPPATRPDALTVWIAGRTNNADPETAFATEFRATRIKPTDFYDCQQQQTTGPSATLSFRAGTAPNDWEAFAVVHPAAAPAVTAIWYPQPPTSGDPWAINWQQATSADTPAAASLAASS